ncbi:hypothetical protein MTR67_036362 [Solanum verrucosum]|uniref:Uncharacterized protein n=1 Tax=Solanum verrucosum TaxID=315347 RepID=A0AAF0ZL33_SOLVR|nr:hypothetical protein MTR67_036362 [Solanum verrucosum]
MNVEDRSPLAFPVEELALTACTQGVQLIEILVFEIWPHCSGQFFLRQFTSTILLNLCSNSLAIG